MNILIKLMSIVSLVIAPTLAQMYGTGGAHGAAHMEKKEVNVTIVKTDTTSNGIVVEKNAGQPLIDALKADGVISGESYTIEFGNGELKVNGNLVDVAKYKDLIKGDKMKIEVKAN